MKETLKRNLKLYIKNKNTIVAFCFFVLFLISFLLSFINPIFDIKGIYTDFKHYDITYMTTNDFSVSYIASNNILFYSQNKAQTSTLNDYSGVKSYDNQYGSNNPKPYNFIRIDYAFDSKIIKVYGIEDNMVGEGGITYVLTYNKSLYALGKEKNQITKYDYLYDDIFLSNYKLYGIRKNNLYLIDEDVLIKENIGQVKELLMKDNNVYINNETSTYIIKDNNEIEIMDINYDKIVMTYDKTIYGLYDRKLYELETKKKLDEDVNDIYTCGENALITVKPDGIYYKGSLKNLDVTQNNTKMDFEGYVLGNRNALIIYKDDALYLYDKEDMSYKIMYRRTLMQNIIRYFSLFVVVMITLYFIMSFDESNKRYNRYFDKSYR